MFNTQKPLDNDLPTSSQLLKSTFIAVIVAGMLLLTVIIPAEYGVDPTGVGDLLGLKKMGEIKKTLEEENLNETESRSEHQLSSLVIKDKESKGVNEIKDITEVTISPDQAIEIKLEMKKGFVAKYVWETINGKLNYDLHGDGYKGSKQFISYKKGKMTQRDSGELKAEFDGYHGWFWRNRENIPVTVKLETSGDYIQIKRML